MEKQKEELFEVQATINVDEIKTEKNEKVKIEKL